MRVHMDKPVAYKCLTCPEEIPSAVLKASRIGFSSCADILMASLRWRRPYFHAVRDTGLDDCIDDLNFVAMSRSGF
jgi:hypothetical protein